MSTLALYECLRCRHQWQQPPEPVTCPRCGHLYLHWRNYSETARGAARRTKP
jgi:rubrerythrin